MAASSADQRQWSLRDQSFRGEVAGAKSEDDRKPHCESHDARCYCGKRERRAIHAPIVPVHDRRRCRADRYPHDAPEDRDHRCLDHDGCDNAEPIFVIGMPRSGTTLVERILSSHPMVRSAGELRNFMVALDSGTGGLPGFIFNDAFAERARDIDWSRLGSLYLDSIRHLSGTAPHFVDKLPHNFLFAGFIACALPRAKIVCLRRDAVDTCLSNFRQVFALKSPYFDYSFDLLDTGRYYLLFDRLMSHWRRVLPGRILEIQYEDLVADQEDNTRRLLDFCGLPWDEACLSFEQNQAPVATASAMQVRNAMNRNSIGRWRHYEAQLSGLLQVLAEGGVHPR